MWDELLTALALVMVIEGIMPFLSPGVMRSNLQKLIAMTDQNLRILGFFSMISGVILLYWIH